MFIPEKHFQPESIDQIFVLGASAFSIKNKFLYGFKQILFSLKSFNKSNQVYQLK